MGDCGSTAVPQGRREEGGKGALRFWFKKGQEKRKI